MLEVELDKKEILNSTLNLSPKKFIQKFQNYQIDSLNICEDIVSLLPYSSVKNCKIKINEHKTDLILEVFSIGDSEDIEFISQSRQRSLEYSKKQQKANLSPFQINPQPIQEKQIESFDMGEDEKTVSIQEEESSDLNVSKDMYYESDDELMWMDQDDFNPTNSQFASPISNQFQRIETVDNELENEIDYLKTSKVIDDIQNNVFYNEEIHLEKKISLFGLQKPDIFGGELTDRTWTTIPQNNTKQESKSQKILNAKKDSFNYIKNMMKNSIQTYQKVSQLSKVKNRKNHQKSMLIIKQVPKTIIKSQKKDKENQKRNFSFENKKTQSESKGKKIMGQLQDITNEKLRI